jgi:hypothetical protein
MIVLQEGIPFFLVVLNRHSTEVDEDSILLKNAMMQR